MNEKELFRAFTEQLGEWSRTGKEPELGDWNIRAYLDMQEHRLQRKGFQRTVDYIMQHGRFSRTFPLSRYPATGAAEALMLQSIETVHTAGNNMMRALMTGRFWTSVFPQKNNDENWDTDIYIIDFVNFL